MSVIAVASLAPMITIIVSSSVLRVDAFSALPTSSSSASSTLISLYSLSEHSTPNVLMNDDEISSAVSTDQTTAPLPTNLPKALQIIPSALRLSLFLLLSAPAMAPSFMIEPALAAPAPMQETQGISAITQSTLGTSVRSSVVQSAKLVDAVDLKWERFSDSLRDNKKCDPRTNRRLFDNGTRRDGTPIGNPVLGALCEPEPLKTLDETLVDRVLGVALADAAYETLGSNGLDQASLQQLVDKTRVRVRPAFERAVDAKTISSTGTTSPEATEEARKRQNYNLEVYSRVRAYGEALTTASIPAPESQPPSKPASKASMVRRAGKKLDLVWGRNLLDKLAGSVTDKFDFQSPFPKPEADIPFPYDVDQLTNALGAIEVALQKLQDGGLIGHWEISIPEDDYGEVVTIAVDDDVCLGAQILVREEQSVLRGSPVVAMIRSALEDRARIPYVALDVFFIDPTTTKNELYNPTQLLVSVRNLGEEP